MIHQPSDAPLRPPDSAPGKVSRNTDPTAAFFCGARRCFSVPGETD